MVRYSCTVTNDGDLIYKVCAEEKCDNELVLGWMSFVTQGNQKRINVVGNPESGDDRVYNFRTHR